MIPDPVYFPLIVAGLGVVASVFLSVLAAYFVRRNEQDKWLRQERLVAYSAFLGYAASQGVRVQVWRELRASVGPVSEDVSGELFREFSANLTELLNRGFAVRLLASPPLVRVVHDLVDRLLDNSNPLEEDRYLSDQRAADLREFVRLARVELGSD